MQTCIARAAFLRALEQCACNSDIVFGTVQANGAYPSRRGAKARSAAAQRSSRHRDAAGIVSVACAVFLTLRAHKTKYPPQKCSAEQSTLPSRAVCSKPHGQILLTPCCCMLQQAGPRRVTRQRGAAELSEGDEDLSPEWGRRRRLRGSSPAAEPQRHLPNTRSRLVKACLPPEWILRDRQLDPQNVVRSWQ